MTSRFFVSYCKQYVIMLTNKKFLVIKGDPNTFAKNYARSPINNRIFYKMDIEPSYHKCLHGKGFIKNTQRLEFFTLSDVAFYEKDEIFEDV